VTKLADFGPSLRLWFSNKIGPVAGARAGSGRSLDAPSLKVVDALSLALGSGPSQSRGDRVPVIRGRVPCTPVKAPPNKKRVADAGSVELATQWSAIA
jgi:hypothetical protein